MKKRILSVFIIMTIVISNKNSCLMARELPKQEIFQRPTINNNETGYFVDEYTRENFTFIAESLINFNLQFNSKTYCRYGIADKDNNIVTSDLCEGEDNVNAQFYITDKSEYKFFITNFNPSPLELKQFIFTMDYLDNIIADAKEIISEENSSINDTINIINDLSKAIISINKTNKEVK